MAAIISTNITSPLGLTTEETFKSVLEGNSGLKSYHCDEKQGGWNSLPFDIEASLISSEQWHQIAKDGYTKFESIVFHSVENALHGINIDKSNTLFILSSTKGDIEQLDEGKEPIGLGEIARKISKEVGIDNEPIVVCNACISGVSAIILAQRLLDYGYYTNVVVCGADVQSRFIVSGFQSLKALSPEPCKPFDIERLGLNLGEAAATIVLSNDSSDESWRIENGAIRNDAFHISAPHPKGEGAYKALVSVTENIDNDEIAVIGVHGTATMYNDQMESKAVERAGLLNVPLSALKGYFGHTMGAAGVLETILTIKGLDEGHILASKGYGIRGVSGRVCLSNAPLSTSKTTAIKMLSGFGGCNGAIRVSKTCNQNTQKLDKQLSANHTVKITTKKVFVDGKELKLSSQGKDMLVEIYKERVGNYPKFYKMDLLCKLSLIATELLIESEHNEDKHDEDRAIVLFNRSSSIIADKQFEKSICNKNEFFPSPAAFVYTLPNITTGEVALRHGYHGETSFYILTDKNEKLMQNVLKTTFADKKTKSIIGGWIDCPSENEFECELKIYN